MGAIIHLTVATRPDVACAVSILASHSSKLRKVHCDLALRIVECLLHTVDATLKCDVGDLEAYSDSTFASEKETSRSRAGYVVYNGGGPISWRSKMQRVATSTAEAECMAMSETSKEILYQRQLLTELGEAMEKPTPMFVDMTQQFRLLRTLALHSVRKALE